MEASKDVQQADEPCTLTCPYCARIYTNLSRQYYKMHIRVCQQEKPHCCTICGRGFPKLKALRRHENVHSGQTLQTCRVCGKVVSNKSILKQHMGIHESADTREKRFKCSQCEKSFLFKSSVSKHFKIHTDDAVYKCDGCAVTFCMYSQKHYHCKNCDKYLAMKGDIVEKKEALTANESQHMAVDGPALPQKKQSYHCDMCGKVFFCESALKSHIKTHTGGTCPVCDEILSTTFALKQHMATHEPAEMTESARFNCSKCEKSFVFKQSLNRHEKTHTETVYKCIGCMATFPRYHGIYRHYKHCKKYISMPSKMKNKHCRQYVNTGKEITKGQIAEQEHFENGANIHRLHQCQMCEESFSVRMMLTQHVDAVHNVCADQDSHGGQPYIKAIEDHNMKICPSSEINDKTNNKSIIDGSGVIKTLSELAMRMKSDGADDKSHCNQKEGTTDQNQINITNTTGDRQKVEYGKGTRRSNMINGEDTKNSLKEKSTVNANEISPEVKSQCRKSKRTIKMKTERDFLYDLSHIEKKVVDNDIAIETDVAMGSPDTSIDEQYLPETETPVSEVIVNVEYKNKLSVIKNIRKGGRNESYIQINRKNVSKENAKVNLSVNGEESDDTENNRNASSETNIIKAVQKQQLTAGSGEVIHVGVDYTYVSRDMSVMYRCTTPACNCATAFKWKKKLKQHKQTEHDEKLLHLCVICDSQYIETNVFKSHLRLAHSEKQYVPLKLVNTQIVKNEIMDMMGEHLADFHVDVCTACGSTFESNRSDSYQHECVPKDISFFCPFCKHVGCEFSKVKGHIVESHPDLLQTYTGSDTRRMYENLHYKHVIPADGGPQGQADTDTTADANEAGDSTCTTCGRTFATTQELQSHSKAHTGIRPFACGMCGYSYMRRTALKRHMLNHSGNGVKCQLCPKRYANQSLLDAHERTHSVDRQYQCDICGDRYRDEKSLKIHVSMKHKTFKNPNTRGGSGSSSCQCDLCGVFLQPGKLPKHLQRKHTAGNMACTYCPQKFTTQRQLQRHKRLLHSSLQLYGTCMEPTSGRTKYSSYVIRDAKSPSRKPLVCALCGGKFRRTADIHSHLRRVHRAETDKEYFCSICQRGFSRAQEVQVHMRSHTNSRPYVCRLCGKRYKQIGHIRQHLLTHSTSCSSCRICQKQFKTDVNLFTHVKKHCQLVPYKCPSCAEGFMDLNPLLTHCLLCKKHDVNKIYACHMCPQEFNSVVLACKHLVSHKADKPFVCKKCTDSFSQYVQLYKHKVEAGHFTQDEITSARTRQQVLTSSCPVDMDGDELIKQYDYEPSDNLEYEMDSIRGRKSQKKCKLARKQKESGTVRKEQTMAQSYQIVVREQSSSGDVLITVAPQLTDVGDPEQRGNDDYTSPTRDQATNLDTATGETIEIEGQVIKVEQCSIWDTEVVMSAGELECREFDGNHPQSATFEHCQENTPQEFVHLPESNAIPVRYTQEQEYREPKDYTTPSAECNTSLPDNESASSSVLQSTHTMIDTNGNEVVVCIVTDDNTQTGNETNNRFQNVAMQNMIENGVNSEEMRRIILSESDTEYNHIKPNSNPVDWSVSDAAESGGIAVDLPHDQPVDGTPSNTYGAYTDGGTKVDVNKTDIDEVGQDDMNYKIDRRYYNRDQSEIARPFKCKECPKRFKRAGDLNLHSSGHLRDADRKYKCRFCGKGFPVPSRLKVHENIHLGVKPYTCKHCQMSFRQQGHLLTHIRIHANYRPFKCDMCSKSYTTQTHLDHHARRHDYLTDRRKHKCDTCHKVYIEKRSLTKHLLAAHGGTLGENEQITNCDQSSIQRQSDIDNSAGSACMCDVCGKVYPRPRDLQNHLLSHSEDAGASRLVKCSRCTKLFTSPELMQQHMLCHEKSSFKYQCEICGQSISTKQGVQRHIQRWHVTKA